MRVFPTAGGACSDIRLGYSGFSLNAVFLKIKNWHYLFTGMPFREKKHSVYLVRPEVQNLK